MNLGKTKVAIFLLLMLPIGRNSFGAEYEVVNSDPKEHVNLVFDLMKYNKLFTVLTNAKQSTKVDLYTQIPKTLFTGAMASMIYCSGWSEEYPLMFKLKAGYLCYGSYLVYDGFTKKKKIEESIYKVSRDRDIALSKLIEIFGIETTEHIDSLKFDNPDEWKFVFSKIGLEDLDIEAIASSYMRKNKST